MSHPQHVRPLWYGVLLASLAPPLCLVSAMFFSRTGDPSATDMLYSGTLAFALAFAVSLITMFLLGLPLVIWLRSRNRLSIFSVITGATAIGAVAIAILTLAVSWDHRLPEPLQLVYGAGVGLVAGIAFCIGAGPNNSFKPTPLRGAA